MGIDLVSACIFCAGFLLSGGLTPRPGLSTDIGLSYATLSRLYDPQLDQQRFDVSDVTPKFLLVGLGKARLPSGGLGAGTPLFEWRVMVAFAPSHDEQIREASPSFPKIETDGTGRYENFALLGRIPVGARDSVELGINRRSQKATDVLNIGGQEQEISEQRSLTAERADGAVGWRHFWRGFEASASVRYAKLTGYNATAGAFMNSSGGIFGGTVGGRYRSGGWTALLDAEYLNGSIDVHEESFPAFEPRDAQRDSTLESLRVGVGYSWPRSDLFVTATFDREKLPFVALAVLGAETVAFDDGYSPDSTNKEFFGDLTFRYAFSPAIRARIGLRLATGNETVVLSDALGDRPARTEEVDRGGRWGGGISTSLGYPELTLFVGADFAIGTSR